ncbi:transposase [Corynebacterium sp. MNWGS58]
MDQRSMKLVFIPTWCPFKHRELSINERSLTTTISPCYFKGLSAECMNDLVTTLGINNLSKPQATGMAKELDAIVNNFPTQPFSKALCRTGLVSDSLLDLSYYSFPLAN